MATSSIVKIVKVSGVNKDDQKNNRVLVIFLVQIYLKKQKASDFCRIKGIVVSVCSTHTVDLQVVVACRPL